MPSFLSTTVLAFFRKGRRYLSFRLVFVRSVSALATSSPSTFRKLNRISSSPSAELNKQLASVAVILSSVVNYSTIKASLLVVFTRLDRSA